MTAKATPAPEPSGPRDVVLPASAAGLRLDKALSERFPEQSRTVVAAWIEAGRVTVGGKALAGKAKVRGGERVRVDVPPPTRAELVPEDRPLQVLFEDETLLVLDKPSGLTVHPGSGQKDGTLANALVFHLRNLPTIGGHDRPGIVHRLDKDTSGVMLVAKTDVAHRALSRQFAAREVRKEYLAVVHGTWSGEGRIDLPLGRSSAGRTKMAVRVAGGRPAVTEWKVEERMARHTLVRCFPHTGRTHQIRVHLLSQDHPIVGDPIYGWKSSPGEDLVSRLLLHAHRIAFAHPTTGAACAFEAPIPPAFLAALAALRGVAPTSGKRAGPRAGPRR